MSLSATANDPQSHTVDCLRPQPANHFCNYCFSPDTASNQLQLLTSCLSRRLSYVNNFYLPPHVPSLPAFFPPHSIFLHTSFSTHFLSYPRSFLSTVCFSVISHPTYAFLTTTLLPQINSPQTLHTPQSMFDTPQSMFDTPSSLHTSDSPAN